MSNTLLLALFLLCICGSSFFSGSETGMMALNRYRLKHLVRQGKRSARLTQDLLDHTDRLLGVILLGNNLINAAAATLTAVLAERLFGQGKFVLAAGTVAITFLILVFSEVTPKVVGAAYADRVAPMAAIVLAPLLKVAKPAVWFAWNTKSISSSTARKTPWNISPKTKKPFTRECSSPSAR